MPPIFQAQPAWIWQHHPLLWRQTRPGLLRASGRRDHRLLVPRAVPVRGAHRAGAGRAVRTPLSSGTVAALAAGAAGRLDGFLERVRGQIAAGGVAGFDGTGFRVEGRLRWVRCARTGKYTLLMVRPGRGKEAIEAMSVLPAFTGVAVHDAWAPCDLYAGADHQLCCARALRELRAVADAAPGGQWFRAAGALTAMQTPVREAISRPPARAAARPTTKSGLSTPAGDLVIILRPSCTCSLHLTFGAPADNWRYW